MWSYNNIIYYHYYISIHQVVFLGAKKSIEMKIPKLWVGITLWNTPKDFRLEVCGVMIILFIIITIFPSIQVVLLGVKKSIELKIPELGVGITFWNTLKTFD